MQEEDKDLIETKIYEIGYHLLPTLSEVDVLPEVSKIHSLISEKGGLVISEGAPQMRQLAYDISKKVDGKSLAFNKAYFGWIKFEMDPSHVADINLKLESMPDILRFLVVKTVRENTMHAPKAPMFRKDSSRETPEAGTEEKPQISEAEIDKSIDELVIN